MPRLERDEKERKVTEHEEIERLRRIARAETRAMDRVRWIACNGSMAGNLRSTSLETDFGMNFLDVLRATDTVRFEHCVGMHARTR